MKTTRLAIINLWRPLNLVTRDDLALPDICMTEEEDLAAVYADLPNELTQAKTGYTSAACSRSEAWGDKDECIA